MRRERNMRLEADVGLPLLIVEEAPAAFFEQPVDFDASCRFCHLCSGAGCYHSAKCRTPVDAANRC